MKEFKFYSNGFELPVSVCETQKEAVYEITSAREALKLLDKEGECEGGCEKLIIDVIYKDGSTYYNSNNYAEEGKFKRTGIARAMVSTEYGTVAFGDFAITEYGDVSIDESDIEEYGVYAGQYDVKEQEVQEAVEQTVETAAEGTSEVETTEQAERETIDMKTQVINNNSAEIQVAVENWYMNGKPSSSYFTMNGEKYAVLPRYGTSSNEFDVFKVKTFTIGKGTYHYPYYDTETREPIDRIAVVIIPRELISKKEAQIAEEENNNTLFEDFFKEV